MRIASHWKDGHHAEAVSEGVPRRCCCRGPYGPRTDQAGSQRLRDFEATLHNWLKKAEIEEGSRSGLTEAERAEIREIKKRNRLLEQENEVLRRAAAYLSQANLPGK